MGCVCFRDKISVCLSVCLSVLFVLVETGSLCIALDVLELPEFLPLCLLSAGIKGVHHHLVKFKFCKFFPLILNKICAYCNFVSGLKMCHPHTMF